MTTGSPHYRSARVGAINLGLGIAFLLLGVTVVSTHRPVWVGVLCLVAGLTLALAGLHQRLMAPR